MVRLNAVCTLGNHQRTLTDLSRLWRPRSSESRKLGNVLLMLVNDGMNLHGVGGRRCVTKKSRRNIEEKKRKKLKTWPAVGSRHVDRLYSTSRRV